MKNKPFLKWAGGKYRLLKHILPNLPQGKRLLEPFVGSAAVFLNTNFSSYLLNDKNPHLITIYDILQNEGPLLIEKTRSLFKKSRNNKLTYYKMRQHFNKTKNPLKKAAYFVYLNRHGFNGLCRYNNQGYFNVPFGSYLAPLFPETRMRFFQEKSQDNVIFSCADFELVFEQAYRGDIIYCDPPYVPLNDTAFFTKYTRDTFSENDHYRLAELSEKVRSRGITVLISNHATLFTRQLYKSAKIIEFPIRRAISCKANERRIVQELIAIYTPTSKKRNKEPS